MSPRIAQLKEAVETMHKCTARHVESKPVIELFQGKVAWDGVVEAFELTGHPHAKRCYAWSYMDKGEPQYVTVLEITASDPARACPDVFPDVQEAVGMRSAPLLGFNHGDGIPEARTQDVCHVAIPKTLEFFQRAIPASCERRKPALIQPNQADDVLDIDPQLVHEGCLSPY